MQDWLYWSGLLVSGLLLIGLGRCYQAYKTYRKRQRQADDDLLIAYVNWRLEQDLKQREAAMAQARKEATPSFQDVDFRWH